MTWDKVKERWDWEAGNISNKSKPTTFDWT